MIYKKGDVIYGAAYEGGSVFKGTIKEVDEEAEEYTIDWHWVESPHNVIKGWEVGDDYLSKYIRKYLAEHSPLGKALR